LSAQEQYLAEQQAMMAEQEEKQAKMAAYTGGR
jgi:hypothetical protein